MAWLLWERAPLSRYLRRRQRGFHETDLQVAGGVLAEPGKEARAGVGDALGGAQNPFTFGPFADGEEDLAHRTLDARPVHLMLAGNLFRQNPSTLQQTRQTVQIRDGECGLRRLEDSRVRLLDPHNPGGDHAVEVPHPAEVLEHLDEQDVPVRDYVGLEPHLPQPAQHGLRLWVWDQGGPALRHFY